MLHDRVYWSCALLFSKVESNLQSNAKYARQMLFRCDTKPVCQSFWTWESSQGLSIETWQTHRPTACCAAGQQGSNHKSTTWFALRKYTNIQKYRHGCLYTVGCLTFQGFKTTRIHIAWTISGLLDGRQFGTHQDIYWFGIVFSPLALFQRRTWCPTTTRQISRKTVSMQEDLCTSLSTQISCLVQSLV